MSADETEMTAAAWLGREDRGLTAEEQDALALWLEQSILHKVAYLRLKAAWQRADRLAALKSPAPVVHGQSGFRPLTLLAIAASIALLLGADAYFTRHAPAGQNYATDIGRMQAVRLADGTQVELNTNTRLHADVTGASRTVRLDSGEAYFDVVHDASRPFTVYAGNRRITDLGTKFSVFRNGDDVRVTVREGRVQVDVLGGQAANAPVVAQAGHMVMAKGDEALVLARNDGDIENGLSWRSGMLVFNQQTLA